MTLNSLPFNISRKQATPHPLPPSQGVPLEPANRARGGYPRTAHYAKMSSKGRIELQMGVSGAEIRKNTCWWRPFLRSSSKTKQKLRKLTFNVEECKVVNHLKYVFPKFRADRSHVRGVNDRSKFRKKIEIRESAFEKVT